MGDKPVRLRFLYAIYSAVSGEGAVLSVPLASLSEDALLLTLTLSSAGSELPLPEFPQATRLAVILITSNALTIFLFIISS